MTKTEAFSIAVILRALNVVVLLTYVSACEASDNRNYRTITQLKFAEEVEAYLSEENIENTGRISCLPGECDFQIVAMYRDIARKGVMSKQQRITLKFGADEEIVSSKNEVVWSGP